MRATAAVGQESTFGKRPYYHSRNRTQFSVSRATGRAMRNRRPCVPCSISLAVMIGLSLATTLALAAGSFNFVEYQGTRIQLARSYQDIHDYKDDPNNLDESARHTVDKLMRSAPFGPRFADTGALSRALGALQFPGYGSFYANQSARPGTSLEFVYVEAPSGAFNRYVALEKTRDGSFLVVDDFVAPRTPEITGVHRNRDGSLVYTGVRGIVVVPPRN